MLPLAVSQSEKKSLELPLYGCLSLVRPWLLTFDHQSLIVCPWVYVRTKSEDILPSHFWNISSTRPKVFYDVTMSPLTFNCQNLICTSLSPNEFFVPVLKVLLTTGFTYCTTCTYIGQIGKITMICLHLCLSVWGHSKAIWCHWCCEVSFSLSHQKFRCYREISTNLCSSPKRTDLCLNQVKTQNKSVTC